jgi:peptidoglycan-N-acetylmuramic acid deacetylase
MDSCMNSLNVVKTNSTTNGVWEVLLLKRLLGLLLLLTVTFSLVGAHQAAAAYSNAPIHWGFKKSKNHEPASAGEEYDKLLAKYGAFYIGDTTKKDIYLTFDNGYENGYTEKVLDVLKEKKVPATFFVTGHYLKDQSDLVKRMAKEGHIVGNHSWYHPDLTSVSDERLRKELDSVREETKRLTGQDVTYLRPPRGIFSERTLGLSRDLGYQNVFWSLAFVDWHINNQRGWEYAYNNIMRQIHPGAILLLHTVSRDNAEALGKAIDDLREEGYTFRSLDHLMAEKSIKEELLFNMN